MGETEIIAQLLERDDEFKSLYERHRELDSQVASLEAKAHLSPEEEVEVKRLKKLKLSIKDQLEQRKRMFLGGR
ncbi:MAG: YdcH family protein [Candidatus Methanosuratincola sp.]|jgi:uncharacterized protein YdcH (DUF465 family)